MTRCIRWARIIGLTAGVLASVAAAENVPLVSPEVHADRTVTVRYFAPEAKVVTSSWDFAHQPIPMQRDASGLWSFTTPPLTPAWHYYSLKVDGEAIWDPRNEAIASNYAYRDNRVRVWGTPRELWDETAAPKGVLHHHRYLTNIIRNLPDNIEDYTVYTPPGYQAKAGPAYPVLYLLHGWGGKSDEWLQGGQVDAILDNMIAQHRIVPMIVVMPQGYGNLEFVLGGNAVWGQREKIAENLELFSQALLKEILPQVEADYQVTADRLNRAIAGLSMGGGESLQIGLQHSSLFSWIGGFSSAVNSADFSHYLPADFPSGAQPRLLWIACGLQEDLLAPNRKLVAWLGEKGIRVTAVETPGIHNWPVWRDDFIRFAPLLFR